MTSFRDTNPAAWAAGRARARGERDAALPGMRAAVAQLEAQVATNDPDLYTVKDGRTSSKVVDLGVLRHGITQIEAAIAAEQQENHPCPNPPTSPSLSPGSSPGSRTTPKATSPTP